MKYLFSLAIIICAIPVFAQYQKIEVKCNCSLNKCDTTLIEYYNEYDQLIKKYKNDDNSYIILYSYNTNGKVIKKQKFDLNKNLLSYNKISYRPDNEWYVDSLFNVDKSLKTVFLRTRDSIANCWVVFWKIGNEETPSVEQRIVADSLGNELLNTTCYSPYNCITYKSTFRNNIKTNMETWVMEMSKNSPTLKEVEEYVIDENNFLKAMIKSDEKGDCIEKRFYSIVK